MNGKTVGEQNTSFLLDGDNIVAETRGGSLVSRYVYGVNLVSWRSGTTLRYYHQNAHGDIVKISTAAGAVARSYDYDAFGNEKNPSSTDANPFRYCGEYWDSETETYYLRARYYDPSIGRFTQQDTHWNTANMIYGDNPQKINERQDALGLTAYTYVPQISAIMQSGNLYVYAVNNPVLYRDQKGTVITPANVVGAVIGAGGGALLGTLVADYYGLTGWQRNAAIAGFTAGGAVLGWFAGPLVEKLAMTVATKLGLISSATPAAVQKVSEKIQPIIGNKLDYIFGKATGNLHNIQRSKDMLRQLQRIGIFDNASGRQYITQMITEAFYHSQSVSQGDGKVVKDILLMGPNGGLKMQTIWQGEKLITILLFGGSKP